MTHHRHLRVVATGQSATASRSRASSRDQSGIRTNTSPRSDDAQLAALRSIIEQQPSPSWAYGPTAAALHGFPGCRLKAPYHVVVLGNDAAIDHPDVVAYRASSLDPRRLTYRRGVAVTVASAALAELRPFVSPKRHRSIIERSIRQGRVSGQLVDLRLDHTPPAAS